MNKYWILKIFQSMESLAYFYRVISCYSEDSIVLFQSKYYFDGDLCKKDAMTFVKLMRDSKMTVNEKKAGTKCYYNSYSYNNIYYGHGIAATEKKNLKSIHCALKKEMSYEMIVMDALDRKAYSNIPIDSKIMNWLFSLDGVGFEKVPNGIPNYPLEILKPTKCNPTKKMQWENEKFIFWNNDNLRDNFFKKIMDFEESK